MELNKRKSLLTPAAPTVWGMIHGDISNQQDLIDKINSVVEGVEVDLTGYATEDWVKEQGYLTEHQSLDNYYTKNEVDNAIDNIEVDVDLTGYATESWVKEQGYLTEHQSLDNYYTKDEVDNAIDNIEVDVDLTGYATEDWVKEQGYLTSIPSEYITEEELNTAIEGVDVDLTAYATIEYVNTQIGEINTITEDILS